MCTLEKSMKADPTTLPDAPEQVAEKKQQPPPALLYEMMRSFVALADNLNLSRAVRELGSTRQTVRRHITNLEECAGAKLFAVEDRHYRLTERGAGMLAEARDLVARGQLWVSGNVRHQDGLQGVFYENAHGWYFYQQHQPLAHAWERECSIMRDAIRDWAASGGYIEEPAFQNIRPYVLVYRKSGDKWICVEIGEESFFAKWWGWKNARSSIGRDLSKFPGGEEFESLLQKPFNDLEIQGGLRLDEVVTKVPREPGEEAIPAAYQRLLMGGRFPDDSLAMIAVVDRSEEIRIPGIDQQLLAQMPKDGRSSYKK